MNFSMTKDDRNPGLRSILILSKTTRIDTQAKGRETYQTAYKNEGASAKTNDKTNMESEFEQLTLIFQLGESNLVRSEANPDSDVLPEWSDQLLSLVARAASRSRQRLSNAQQGLLKLNKFIKVII